MNYEENTMVNKLINGKIGYGSLCISNTVVDLILLIIFPPIYVITYQVQNYFSNKNTDNNKIIDNIDIGQIITSIILTSCFYFPGLIHALYIMQNNNKSTCMSLF